MHLNRLGIALTLTAIMLVPRPVSAQTPLTNAITYQGQLKNGGAPATGVFDLRFSLWNALIAGAQVGSTICLDNVNVAGGLFTVSLDFGAQFNGDQRFLQIAVKPGGAVGDCAVGTYTTLSPRQPLTAAPYALYSLSGPGSGGPWTVSGNNIFNTNTGDVGIGTASPTRLLHTVGDAVLFERAINDAAVLLRNTLNGTINAAFGLHNSGASDGYAYLTDQTQTPLLHLHSGNVGIGITNPSAKLHVETAAAGQTAVNGIVTANTGAAGTFSNGLNGNFSGDTLTALCVGNANSQAFVATHFGTGDCAVFEITSATSGGEAVEAITNGTGQAVLGTNTGTGQAGYFRILNPASGGTALYCETNGTGLALHANGTARVDVLEITGADLAEKFPVSEDVKPGMVVMIDAVNPGKLCLARGAYNKRVAGVVSGANGLSAGTVLGHLPGNESAPPIALSGRVWVQCDAGTHAIEPGDLLTTAEQPGCAMTALDLPHAQGAMIGKAMTALEKGRTGLVLVLVNLQ